MSLHQHVLMPKIFSGLPHIKAAMSTRNGGVSAEPFGMNTSFDVGDDEQHVRKNRELFFSIVGADDHRVFQPSQVHSAQVKSVGMFVPGEECDGLLSNQQSKFLAVTVADCVPILLADPVQRVVGAVHAGWRGTARRIVVAAIERMQKEYGVAPKNILAWIGPSASSCCYEVGEEVAKLFASSEVDRTKGKSFLDLKVANKVQISEAGVSVSSIEVNPLCTICSPTMFHSFRRDGINSGRMLAVIGIQ